MTASEIDSQVMDLVRDFSIEPLMNRFQLVGSGQQEEILNKSGRPNLYYQWLYCLMKLLKPKQVIELGAAAGISTEMMALATDAKIISVDCDPQSWRWMDAEFPNVTKVLGDDLDLSLYPLNVVLEDTDIWFIDSLHEESQLQKEIDLYSPFWKRGSVVVFDDININPGMRKVWDSLNFDKFENNLLHWSGFGLLLV